MVINVRVYNSVFTTKTQLVNGMEVNPLLLAKCCFQAHLRAVSRSCRILKGLWLFVFYQKRQKRPVWEKRVAMVFWKSANPWCYIEASKKSIICTALFLKSLRYNKNEKHLWLESVKLKKICCKVKNIISG